MSRFTHFCVEQKLSHKSCPWSKNDKYHVWTIMTLKIIMMTLKIMTLIMTPASIRVQVEPKKCRARPKVILNPQKGIIYKKWPLLPKKGPLLPKNGITFTQKIDHFFLKKNCFIYVDLRFVGKCHINAVICIKISRSRNALTLNPLCHWYHHCHRNDCCHWHHHCHQNDAYLGLTARPISKKAVAPPSTSLK